MAKKSAGRRIASAVYKARDRALSGIPEEAAAALLADGSGFQEVTLATIVVLEEIKSPFISKNAAQDTPILDITRALFALTAPIEQVETVLAKSKANCRAAAPPVDVLKLFDQEARLFARKIPISTLNGLAEKIDAHIARSMRTAIPHGEKGEEDDVPLAGGPAQERGSAGSSSTMTS